MGRKRLRIAGGVLMLLLGLARAAGGLVLLVEGGAADPNIHSSGPAVTLVGISLVLIGTILAAAAVGVLRGSRPFRLIGIFSTVIFVIGGAINGYVLYGRPGDRGTLVNLVVAAIILGTLLPGAKRA